MKNSFFIFVMVLLLFGIITPNCFASGNAEQDAKFWGAVGGFVGGLIDDAIETNKSNSSSGSNSGITYYYSISTGSFSSRPSDSWPTCYSGGGAASKRPFINEHKNNPNSTGISDYGPIPTGTWYIVGYYEHHPQLGRYAIMLSPSPGVTNRSDFLIHGDNSSTVGQSSDGCIIMNGEDNRKKIADAIDKYGRLVLIVNR
jgi:hypothetical protein